MRVDGEARGPATIFTSIYLPTGRQGQPYRDALGRHLVSLRTSYPGDTLIVGGDWNLGEAGLSTLLSEWALRLPEPRTLWPSDTTSRARGTCTRGRQRVLDHFVTWPGRTPAPHSPWIGYTWDISDHFPVFASIPGRLGPSEGRSLPAPPPRPRLNARKIPLPRPGDSEADWPDSFRRFVNASPFAPLAELADEEGPPPLQPALDATATSFVAAVWEAARDISIVSVAKIRNRGPPLGATISAHRRAFAAYRGTRGPAVQAALGRYDAARR